MPRRTLILGGAKSGKSQRAEEIASQWPETKKTYVATWRRDLNENDADMQSRILAHQKRRGSAWNLEEVGSELPRLLEKYQAESFVMVDCVTMWLSGLFADSRQDIDECIDRLTQSISQFRGHLVLVAQELGQSLIPADRMSRLFVDKNGLLNQKLAQVVDHVEIVVAGLPVILKGR